jgi:hypothetical protein
MFLVFYIAIKRNVEIREKLCGVNVVEEWRQGARRGHGIVIKKTMETGF